MYNPAIAKFLSVDPLSPEYPELTPYQFASNTPIEAIDLDGLEADHTSDWNNAFKNNDEYNYLRIPAMEEGPGLIEGGKQALTTTGKALPFVFGAPRIHSLVDLAFDFSLEFSLDLSLKSTSANLLGQSVFQGGYAWYNGDSFGTAASRIDLFDATASSFGWNGLIASAIIDYTPNGGLRTPFHGGKHNKSVTSMFLDFTINGSLKLVGGALSNARTRANNAYLLNSAERNSLVAGGNAAFPDRWLINGSDIRGANRIRDVVRGLSTAKPTLAARAGNLRKVGPFANTYNINITGKNASGYAKKAAEKRRILPNRIIWSKRKFTGQTRTVSDKEAKDLKSFLKGFK